MSTIVPKLSTYYMVLVEWLDAETDEGWQDLPCEKIEHSPVKTCGYLVHEDENYILIAHSITENECNGRIKIPKVLIRSRTAI